MLAGATPPCPDRSRPVWYQVAVSAPGYDVTGVSLPGLPGVADRPQPAHRLVADRRPEPVHAVLRRADQQQPSRPVLLARSLAADAAGAATRFRSAAARPRQLTVELTVHGPVMTRAGRTTSVDWTGSIGSPDIAVLARIGAAGNFTQFHAALGGLARARRRPSSTPTTAATSEPSRPATSRSCGTGRRGCRCRGPAPTTWPAHIPYAALPHSYDPPGHVVASARAAAGHRRLPVLHRHRGERPRPGRPARCGLRGPWRRSRHAAGWLRRTADQPGRPSWPCGWCPGCSPRCAAGARLMRPSSRPPRCCTAGTTAWRRIRRGGDLVDVLVRLPVRDVPAVVAGRCRSRRAGSGRACDLALGQVRPGPGAGAVDARRPVQPRVHARPEVRAGTAASVMRAAFGTAVAQLPARLGGAPASWSWGRLRAARSCRAAGRLCSAQVPELGHGAGRAAARRGRLASPAGQLTGLANRRPPAGALTGLAGGRPGG